LKPRIPASLRERKRYLVFEIIAPQNEEEKEESCCSNCESYVVNERDLLRAIWEALYSLFGDVGVAACNIWLIDFDEKKGVGILRCSHRKVEEVRAALACIKIGGRPLCIRVVRTTGTVKAARSIARRIQPLNISTK